jgi:hypothetical protein
MLQRLLESLQEEELGAGATGVKENVLQLAETVLLDAAEEDYNGHDSPFFCPRRTTEQVSPNELPLANPDDLELELQRQLEQASLTDSVDSGQYEYRNQPADHGVTSAGVPSPLLQDLAFNRHLRATAHSLSL